MLKSNKKGGKRKGNKFPGGASSLPARLVFFLLAALIGIAVSFATVLLIEAISFVQLIGYGARSESQFASIAAQQPWWRLMLVPLVGGLMVGIIINLLPSRRYHGIADVMEACAFNSGRMGVRSGVMAAIAAALSLGSGAPLGREGPAVHIGASISAWFAERLGLDRSQTLALLGCGAAAAVTTSFNAPIAGVIFALEVVVGYYTLRVFAPVVIASLSAVAVHGYYFGSAPMFELEPMQGHSLLELPLFALLGVLAGLMVTLFIYSLETLRSGWERSALPLWSRPAVAGLIIGIIAIQYPMILSIGYEPTKAALQEMMTFGELATLLVLKLAGTAIALSSGFAGGIFSPSVFMGAMLGGVFILPVSSLSWFAADQALYSVAGMAAVSSAMLGAPISTILIVFEITRDYNVTLAVMTAAAFASTTMQMGPHTSFFRWQLANRNINISAGRDVSLLRTQTVEKLVSQVFTRVKAGDSLRDVESQLGVSRKRIAIALDDDGKFVGSAELKEIIATSTAMAQRKHDELVAGETNAEDTLEASDDSSSHVSQDNEAQESNESTDAKENSDDKREEPWIETIEQMTRDESVSATLSTNLVIALQKMAEQEIDYLPVLSEVDQGQREIVGIIFKADVLAEHYSVLRKAREEEFGVN